MTAEMWQLLVGALMFQCFVNQSSFSLELSGGKTESGKLSLKCFNPGFHLLPLKYVYWRRNNTNVVQTQRLWWTHFYEGSNLDNTKVSRSWRSHRILIRDDLESNFASTWSCSEDETEGFTSPKVFGQGKTVPAIINGNLTLEVFPKAPVESEEVTFSCTIDTQVPGWEVMWTRNMHPVFLTGNSSLLIYQNITTSDNMTVDLENVAVSTSEIQHNITLIAKSVSLNHSTWFCQSDVAVDYSNNITIEIIQKVEIIKTTKGPGPKPKADQSSEPSSTYIVVGLVCAVVVLAAVMTITIVIRKKKQNKDLSGWSHDTSALTPKRKSSIVMEDNILYVTNEDAVQLPRQSTSYLDRNNTIMVENTLYVSSEENGTRKPEPI